MNPTPILLAACVMLSGCAAADRQAVLTNLQGCERHYLGTVNAGPLNAGFNGSVQIDCPTSKGAPPVTVGTTVGGPNQ